LKKRSKTKNGKLREKDTRRDGGVEIETMIDTEKGRQEKGQGTKKGEEAGRMSADIETASTRERRAEGEQCLI